MTKSYRELIRMFINAHDALQDLSPDEVLDIALHKLQSDGIQLVEWDILLHRRMNVPLIVSSYAFLVPDEDIQRASSLLQHLGLSLQTPSKVSLAAEGDMRVKGRHHLVGQSAIIPSLKQHLVIYPLSFAAFRPCEIMEQPAEYSKLHLCARILVPRPSAVYASLLRMMRCYPTYSSTWMVLRSDMAQLTLYHLMGYTLETISEEDDKDDEDRRSEDAVETIREWGLRKEWGEGEEWMEEALLGLLRGTYEIDFPPERRASP